MARKIGVKGTRVQGFEWENSGFKGSGVLGVKEEKEESEREKAC